MGSRSYIGHIDLEPILYVIIYILHNGLLINVILNFDRSVAGYYV